ncbi:nicotinate phosphoribosyltransferase [Pontibacillus halophilus JSM 076056 = DSM 19796]|uniref:Nicotinate phosphoribosyltransferase n=1 Tax=Pontibacillus halophilus JSM 076056 = DSM 19796 TaxID=1385510 RepID=A0A0A5I718_9BACI|nr:nicotinate phosphoribosyltransferase [Pontibacillus halophilus]KGX91632.1 nicotinate phosphoribosyltransferase [Pontibacillus halophilus JSM 076056 = DSM 19796]
MNHEHNVSLHVDYYLPRWMYIHWKNNRHDTRTVFQVYFRDHPFGSGYSVFLGLNSIVTYLSNLSFSEEEIDYLQEQLGFEDEFKEELRNYSFNGTVMSMREGEIVFPNEPLVNVEARVFEAKLLQTALLTYTNHESLIGTKASRISEAVTTFQKVRRLNERPLLLEGGARRAHGMDAGENGARAAYIAGFDSSSLIAAGYHYAVPVGGTMEHSDIQIYEEWGGELQAFRDFARAYPHECTLLVDTFDTLKSGVPNAITVAKELEDEGAKLNGIRIDSGDLAYLAKESRRLLDEAGLPYVKIMLSGDIDEYEITALTIQDTPCDAFLVGTKVSTAYEEPAFGAVYKIVAVEGEHGEFVPLIKLSSSENKTTNPGYQTVYRIFDKETGAAKGDYISTIDEEVPSFDQIELDNVRARGRKDVLTNFTVENLMHTIIQDGELVEPLPTVDRVRAYHKERLSRFWEEYRRKEVPQTYSITLSKNLQHLKETLIDQKRGTS